MVLCPFVATHTKPQKWVSSLLKPFLHKTAAGVKSSSWLNQVGSAFTLWLQRFANKWKLERNGAISNFTSLLCCSKWSTTHTPEGHSKILKIHHPTNAPSWKRLCKTILKEATLFLAPIRSTADALTPLTAECSAITQRGSLWPIIPTWDRQCRKKARNGPVCTALLRKRREDHTGYREAAW